MIHLLADMDSHNFFVPPIIIPLVCVAGAFCVAIAGIYFHFQRQKLWHETMRVSLEKGVPLPPNFTPDRSVTEDCGDRWGRRRPFRDLRTGLILVAVGLAICFQMSGGRGVDWHSGGAIPLYIGVAFLISAFIGAVFGRR